MYRRFSYILPWNLSSGCALVKVFGFVASLLASCKGKKEKKRKKYILPLCVSRVLFPTNTYSQGFSPQRKYHAVC